MHDPSASASGFRISRRHLLTSVPRVSDGEEYWIRVHRKAMACRFEVTLSGEDARHVPDAQKALDEADRVEGAITVFRDSSALVALNRTAAESPVPVDEELFLLLARCRALHAETEGAYDVTTTPLSRAWGFLARAGRRPTDVEIAAARACVGMDGVALDEAARTVRFLRPGLELNLGSIGKGYALERMAAALRAGGVEHALVSAAGSSIRALGGRGRGFRVDLTSRRSTRGLLARLRLRDAALGTSGAAEQFFEIQGTRYGHVLDPRTGWPAAGVLSATVVADDAATADALSTAFLVGGLDLARRYCASHPGVLALVTPDDGSERPQLFGAHRGATVAFTEAS
jgi:thiamine biosynthesis lipoprotein